MNLLKDVLEELCGNIHFFISFGEKPAAEVKFKDKDIIIEIKNPLLAAEVAVEEILENRKNSKFVKYLEKIKNMGYRIKVKYKLLEIDI